MKRAPFVAVAFALVAVVALAAPALGAPIFARGNFTGEDPVLAGDDVVYQEFGSVFMLAGPLAKQLFALPGTRNASNSYVLDASGSRVALVHDAEFDSGGEGPGDEFFTAYTAPLRQGSPTKIGDIADRAISVSGDVVAYSTFTGMQSRLVARDFAPGGATKEIAAQPGFGPQVAGRFVANRPSTGNVPGSVVVYDRTTGAEVYRTPPAGTNFFSLGEDGTVVTSTQGTGDCGTTVSWSSVADPTAHAVALGAVCGEVRYAGGRIAAIRSRNARTVELVLADLAGNARAVAVQPAGKDTPALGLFLHDLSPTRLLYSQSRCSGRLLTIEGGLDGAFAPAALPAVSCPISVVNAARVKATANGKVFVALRCPRLCTETGIVIRAGGKRVASRDVTLVLSRPPSPALVDLQLNRATRRTLAARGSLSATITATTSDLDGRSRTASKSVTIVRG